MASWFDNLTDAIGATTKPEHQLVGNKYDLIDITKGKLDLELFKTLNADLKILISSTLKKMYSKSLPEADRRDLEILVGRNAFIESISKEEVMKTLQFLPQRGTNGFDFQDGRPDPTIIQKIEKWLVELIDDKDVIDRYGINAETLSDLVAEAGAKVACTSCGTRKRESHELQASVLNVGMVRLPDGKDNPHLKLYHIKVTAFSVCHQQPTQADKLHGFTGELGVKKFRPCKSQIKKMTASEKQEAFKEAEAWL